MPAPLNRDEVVQTLCRLAAKQANVDPAAVTPQTHLFADLNFDSLNVVEYTMEIEDAFEVSIPDELAQDIKTVGDAIERLMQVGASDRVGA